MLRTVVLIYAKNCPDSVIILDMITEAFYISFYTCILLLHRFFTIQSNNFKFNDVLLGHKLYVDEEHNIIKDEKFPCNELLHVIWKKDSTEDLQRKEHMLISQDFAT